MDSHLYDFLDQLQSDFESNKGDLTIQLQGDQTIKVWKHLVCLRSPVIAAMFDGDTKESQTNTIDMSSFKTELVKQFLRYLYIATIENLDLVSMEMFEIADYYDVKLLRKACIEEMFKNLNQTNVMNCFELAEKFSLNELWDKAVLFMKENVNLSTMYDYYMFGKKHSLVPLKNFVKNFIETSMTEVCKSQEWEKFDGEFRLWMLEQHFKDYPMLEVKEIPTPSNDHYGSSQNKKSFSMKNVGSKNLMFKVEVLNNRPNAGGITKYQGEKEGILLANRSIDFTITYSNGCFCVLVSYELLSHHNNHMYFDQNALVRQFRIDSNTSYR